MKSHVVIRVEPAAAEMALQFLNGRKLLDFTRGERALIAQFATRLNASLWQTRSQENAG